MQPVTYRRRRNALSRSEREWIVEDDALVSRGSGAEKRYRWKDMASVRLTAEPARDRPWRYVFELQPVHQRKIVLDNAHYEAPRTYEDRSAAYTQFVRAALARLAIENPKAQALIGETPKRYFFLLITALLALGALAFALPYSGLIKFGAILLMLPVFWRWVLKAMPRGVALDAIPERALPPSTSG
jgi:hypothetical protein